MFETDAAWKLHLARTQQLSSPFLSLKITLFPPDGLQMSLATPSCLLPAPGRAYLHSPIHPGADRSPYEMTGNTLPSPVAQHVRSPVFK
jgi:hypothetical protein